MRKVLIVLSVSATASLAMASNFSMPSNTSLPGAQTSAIPVIDNTNGTPDTVSVTAVPAPGTAVVAVAGLALLSRRRRDR
ncbi:MAG: hypothetical protein JNK16_02660 [Phycisphaerales bacterium]|nr:hypothetical protein [Phycisphaerales bacterium]